MRDKRFVRDYRGGTLKKEQHYQLIMWASNCSKHVLPLFGEKIDERLINARTLRINGEKEIHRWEKQEKLLYLHMK